MVGRSLIPFFIHACVLGRIVREPNPWDERQPHTWMVSVWFIVGTTQDSW